MPVHPQTHCDPARTRGKLALFIALASALVGALLSAFPAQAGEAPRADGAGVELEWVAVRSGGATEAVAFDGTVQAVRQTVVAAQVSGAVVALEVKAGDSVKAGQLLARLDARAAEQTAAVGAAQLQAARAAQDVADREFERQKQLFAQNYISRAALERAEAQHKSAQAEVAAQRAGAGAAQTTSGFYVVRAPYAGVVAEVAIVLGDMAMPGRPLLTLYDPSALRISVNVPQSAASGLGADSQIRLDVPGVGGERTTLRPTRVQVLPTADAATHTQEVRFDLASSVSAVKPGMFARVWLPTPRSGVESRLYVPQHAVVRRAELTGVYVIGRDGKPTLRQVRIGPTIGNEIELLAGVSAGERVATDPQAAARIR
ncbi:MAG: efflux RND transporter periplasmic adaptor subunit [Caldimonas sp.]